MSGIDLSGVSVAIYMVHRDVDDITVPTSAAIEGTLAELHAHGVPYEISHHIGGVIMNARSACVKRYLETDKTRMFSLDSDLAWKPRDFMRILALSTRYEVIGACYRKKKDEPFYLVGITEDQVHADSFGCIHVAGMGLGFTCIQRQILETLSAKAPTVKYTGQEPMPRVFRFDEIDGEFQGEDMAFCADVRALGYAINMDPSIELGHIGHKQFTGRFSDCLSKADAAAS